MAEAAAEPRSSWTAAGFPYATWDIRRTVLGVLAGLLIGGLITPIPVLIFDPHLDTTAGKVVYQALFEVTLMATAIGVVSSASVQGAALRDDLALLGLRRFATSGYGWVAAGLASYYAAVVAYASLVTTPKQKDVARDLGLNAGPLAAVPVVLVIAVLAPIAEEIFFRGMLFGGLRRRLSTVPAAAISALVFGALHATTGISAVPPLIIFGFVLALLYEKTGSLVPGMIAHMINNSLALAFAS
jgi:membrane protease YdiL (CAAX protease family)